MKYVELHCASAFSFLEGASRPEDLVSRAKELEQPAIALVDRDGVYGAPRFHMDFGRRFWKLGKAAVVDAEFFSRKASSVASAR